ncbi:glycine betaine ABC transporter substrate-binding protein [Streptomyces sp. NPDC050560]|uniref:glycine betaine ABC transporter substrate-binding protein n=1 Tax=Streptomyces sp. NPDC050560 TaxID=3365630 RepID=UPI0037B98E57
MRIYRPRRGVRTRAALAVAVSGALLAGCGLTSGSPMADAVRPGSIGQGEPLKGAHLTVASKEFTEQLVLGAVMGIAFEAGGADVVDRTGIQGSFGARAAVENGDADGMYEYTGTAWITYQGNAKPVPDPDKQWKVVKEADAKKGIAWLPPASLNNTYALALNQANLRKYKPKTLSDVAALAKKNPGAVSLCVEGEFSAREDGLPGMQRAYGMKLASNKIQKMDGGVVYTQVSQGRCTFGEVFTTDGRIQAQHLTVLADDKHFFPNYNVAPEIRASTLKKYPGIADVLDPITKKLTNKVAQELSAKVDVDGEDPHEVALDWLKKEGFVKGG